MYLPKLVSGEWSGTMNLTEPQAGSDVGALRTTADPIAATGRTRANTGSPAEDLHHLGRA
jgi:alkylation response protein AidB-like acyl-CoA dehydrogenase